MDLNICCIFALLLVTVGAARFDQGPQRFFESSSPSPRREQNTENNEVVLYLTPSQIEALEARGAVVRSDELENDESAQQDNEDQPEVSPEQEQEQQAEVTDQQEDPEQAEQLEQEQESGELQDQDIDLEEILRILNEEQIEEQEAKTEQALNVPQVTEETSEEEREIPLRFQVQQQQQKQQQKQKQQQRQQNLLATAEKNARSKIYSAIRYQQLNSQSQRARVQLALQLQQEARQNVQQQEEPQTEAPSLLKRYRLVPYEVEEQPEGSAQQQQEQQAQQEQEEQQEQVEEQQQAEEQTAAQEENQERLNALLTPLLSPERLAEVIGQRKNRLYQNEIELQGILNELKQSPKQNDQKYAIEIERLRANLEKQNTLSKAGAIAQSAPQLIKKQIQKRPLSQSAKQGKVPVPVARNPEPQRQKAPRPQPVPVKVAKPVPIPIRKQNVEVKRPVPEAVGKRVPVTVTRNVYVKVNKPYLVKRT